MDYRDVFAFRDDKNQSEYALNDYKYLIKKYNDTKLKLDENFNLKYYLSKLIVYIDVFNVKEFIEHHYDYCDDPEKYYKILELKVVPTVEDVIEDCQLYQMDMTYYKEKPLEDGFVNTEGIIKKHTFENNYFKHFIATTNKKHELQKKLDILKSFVEDYKSLSRVSSLKWLAGPAKLGVLFQELIDKGYLEGPSSNGDTNYKALAEELLEVFNLKNKVSGSTLQLYLSPNNRKNMQARKNFDFVLLRNKNQTNSK